MEIRGVQADTSILFSIGAVEVDDAGRSRTGKHNLGNVGSVEPNRDVAGLEVQDVPPVLSRTRLERVLVGCEESKFLQCND